MERPEERFGGAVQPWPSRHLQPPALLDKVPVQQQPHGIGAVHATDLVHIGPCGGLIVGDDGQHLQRRLGQLGGLAYLKGPTDNVGILRGGAQLPAVLQTQQPHPTPLKAVIVHKLLQHKLRRWSIQLRRQTDAVDMHRFAGGKQDALHGGLDLFHFPCFHAHSSSVS